jgi:hypothetical protein
MLGYLYLLFCLLKYVIQLGGLNGSYELVKGPVCEVMPAELDCQKNLPWFWNVLGQWMFNPAEGWYAPKYFCSVRFNTEERINVFFNSR